MKVHILESTKWPRDDVELQGQIRLVAELAHKDARAIINAIPETINIVIEPNARFTDKDVVVGGYAHSAELISLNFDPDLPYGRQKLLAELRGAAMHELNHAAHFSFFPDDDSPLIEEAVFEGLATVFERDYAGGEQPGFAKYEDEATMRDWLDEILLAQEQGGKREDLKYMHPDGRRWVLYKTGCWVVDAAMRESGKSIVELMPLPLGDTFALSKLRP